MRTFNNIFFIDVLALCTQTHRLTVLPSPTFKLSGLGLSGSPLTDSYPLPADAMLAGLRYISHDDVHYRSGMV